MSRRTFGMLVPMLLCAWGCDDGSGLPTADSDWCPQYAAAVCQHRLSCCGSTLGLSLQLSSFGISSQAPLEQCTYLVQASCEFTSDMSLASVTAGRMQFDGAAREACLRSIAYASCQSGTSTDDPCGRVFIGVVPLGAECANDDECAGEAFCDITPGTSPGRCRSKGGEGAMCPLPTSSSSSDTGQCLAPLRCVGGPILTRFCVATGTAGAGASCGSDVNCVAGYHCGDQYHCEGAVPAGGSCRTHSICGDMGCVDVRECAEGLVCSNSTCQAGIEEGGTCSGSGSCRLSLYCSDNHCVPRKATDQECRYGYDECQDDLLCSAEGQCQPKGGLGTACLTGQDCEDSLRCVSRGACRSPVAKDAACDGATPCGDGLFCSAGSGTCVEQRSTGEFCSSAGECRSGGCTSGLCVDYCGGGG